VGAISARRPVAAPPAPATLLQSRDQLRFGRPPAAGRRRGARRQSLHVLFIAPEHPAPHRDFVRALKQVGARVSGVGHRAEAAVDAELRGWLDDYQSVPSLFDEAALLAAARVIDSRRPIASIQAADELLTLPAAKLREALGVPGLSVRTATLCRDKVAMKAALRAGGVPTAEWAAPSTAAEVHAFAERVGYPLILKPRAGLATQDTFRVDDRLELEAAIARLKVGEGASIAVEEFIEGHEGFFDTLTIGGEVRHEFISHYFPNVLEAMRKRWISPQIATTNRVGAPSYDELERLGREVVRLLGIETSATHMEWFFGPKGLKFSEIGARPPGERIWDLYCTGNDMDLYREWALAVVAGRSEQTPSRRFATGSIQVRPASDGRITGYSGLEAVRRRCGEWITTSSVPTPGTLTRPMRLGYLENVWFRLRHPDFDELRQMMDFIGATLRVHAEPAG
jgi:carbamoylphosphate synthase large subunit